MINTGLHQINDDGDKKCVFINKISTFIRQFIKANITSTKIANFKNFHSVEIHKFNVPTTSK